MSYKKEPVQMSVLALLIENFVLALAIALGFWVDWIIPLTVIPTMAAVGLFMAWRKK